MKILVTGANGFIGRRLSERLAKEGHEVVAIIRDIDTEDFHESNYRFVVKGDICNIDCVRRTIADYECEQIYHLASQSIVRTCATDPLSAYQVNVMGAVNVMEAARMVGGVKSILVSTSDKAFGHSPPPYVPETPLRPKFTYESTKACQDIISQNYFHNYSLPVKVARCSNVYGPGDPNWSRLIPATINRIAHKESPKLYSDVSEFIREFVYIDDVVDAFTTIQNDGDPGSMFCVGGTGKVKVREVIEMLLRLMDSDLEIEFMEKKDTRFKEIKEQWIDASALNALGWKAKTSLTEGLMESIRHYAPYWSTL